jgi:hypothetical protein
LTARVSLSDRLVRPRKLDVAMATPRCAVVAKAIGFELTQADYGVQPSLDRSTNHQHAVLGRLWSVTSDILGVAAVLIERTMYYSMNET